MPRPSWDEYFLTITKDVKERSTCLRRNVGAILVRDRRILTTGYNGPPKGVQHCGKRGGCLREKLKVPSGQRAEICIAVHAEANAILQAAIHGVAIGGATLYCTTAPCSGCAKLLINVGVDRVVVVEGYADELGVQLLHEAGVTVEQAFPNEETGISIRRILPEMSGSDSGVGTC